MALLINIEGIDGSGKGTQASRLQARLQSRGLKTQLVSFPRYQATSFGRKVADFLNGRFGQLDQVNPFLAALLYAGDRFESKAWLTEIVSGHDVVILDRYVPSNMAHQASKLDGVERTELIDWIEHIEFQVYQLPRPDVTILLDLSPQVAQQLIALKAPRDYTAQAADLQESDANHLSRTRDVYLTLSRTRPEWRRIDCAPDDRLRSADEVESEVWRVVEQRLKVR